MVRDRHLLEQHPLAPLHLEAMVLGAAVLQPLEHPALPRALGKGCAPGIDLGVAAVELERSRLVLPLGPLQVGLESEQLGAAEAGARAAAASILGGAHVLARGAQNGLALHANGERRREVLAGLVLGALAQRANSLEAKLERTGHGPVTRQPRRRLDRRWTPVRHRRPSLPSASPPGAPTRRRRAPACRCRSGGR